MSTLLQSLMARLNDRFTRQLVRDPDVLLVMFRMLDDAEENGEARIFEHVAARLPPRLAALVRRHAADERRHIGLTRQALALLGDRPELVDRRADLVAVMDEHLGSLLAAPAEASDADLGRAYLMLLALERRMCAQLAQLGGALDEVAPQLAAITRSILADELRHVAWCEVVAFELLGRDAALVARVRDEMIALEARVYARVTHDNLRALLAIGLREMGLLERGFWTAVAWALAVVPGVPVVDRTGDLAAAAWSGPRQPPAPRAVA